MAPGKCRYCDEHWENLDLHEQRNPICSARHKAHKSKKKSQTPQNKKKSVAVQHYIDNETNVDVLDSATTVSTSRSISVLKKFFIDLVQENNITESGCNTFDEDGNIPLFTEVDDTLDPETLRDYQILQQEVVIENQDSSPHIHTPAYGSPGYTFSVRKDQSLNFPDCHIKRLISCARLLKIFHDAGCPLYVMDKVMKVLEQEIAAGHLSPSSLPRYRSSLRVLSKLFDNVPKPVVNDIYLDIAKKTIQIPTYDFKAQLQSLLNMDVFSDINNLVVNHDDPLSPYIASHNKFEMQDGEVYQNIVSECKDNPKFNEKEDFIFGLIFYIDKSFARNDMKQKTGIEPLMFTVSLLNKKQRGKAHHWKPLGYIPNRKYDNPDYH